MEIPFAHFATRSVTADIIFSIVWEAVRILEGSGLKVLCITADGASQNRKFFRMHDKKAGIVYKTPNPFSEDERWLISLLIHHTSLRQCATAGPIRQHLALDI